MNIKKPTLAEKQAFWTEQLPLFKEAYWLPEHFELLKFDMEAGNFIVRDDIDSAFEDDADDLYHRINTGWSMWKRAVNHMQKKLEGCVVPVWVATDFLLPDEGEVVLFLDKNDVIHEGSLNTDYVDGPYGENGEDFGDNQTLWTSNSNGEELLPSKVKYWMIRPTCPVEAARGGK